MVQVSLAIRYVVELLIIFRDDKFVGIRSVLRNHGVDAPESVATIRPKGQMTIRLEKSDPRISGITRDLEALGSGPVRLYVPAFETWELEQAELVRLRVYGFCGNAFGTWAWERGLPPGTRVIDKRAMGKKDIAKTYAHNELATGPSALFFRRVVEESLEAIRHGPRPASMVYWYPDIV